MSIPALNLLVDLLLYFGLFAMFVGGVDIVLFLTVNVLSVGLFCVGSIMCLAVLVLLFFFGEQKLKST